MEASGCKGEDSLGGDVSVPWPRCSWFFQRVQELLLGKGSRGVLVANHCLAGLNPTELQTPHTPLSYSSEGVKTPHPTALQLEGLWT